MTIHSALVAEQSPALRSLVTGNMEEARTGHVTWDDVDEETFARFAQFVYTGDYSPASHILLEPDIHVPPESEDNAIRIPEVEPPSEEPIQDVLYDTPVVEDRWEGFGGIKKSKKSEKKPHKSSAKRLSFHDRKYPLPASSTCPAERCMARANTSALEDYTSVFLGHASLYTFAEKYDVEALRSVVLNKLHATLCVFTPYEARYGDILELLQFTYKKTPTRAQLDPLRELVTQYIAYEAKEVIHTERCMSLVEEGGELARDLFAMLLIRVA
ncbi:hypothetical protein MMC18_004905 [Xylographa bjoerkii]|nr:hypothetical protein [Xylographa bjoerkii]